MFTLVPTGDCAVLNEAGKVNLNLEAAIFTVTSQGFTGRSMMSAERALESRHFRLVDIESIEEERVAACLSFLFSGETGEKANLSSSIYNSFSGNVSKPPKLVDFFCLGMEALTV